jgi:Tfp pilus assembly protein PilV
VNPKSSGSERRTRGFSLIEVAVSIGIISFALLSILGVLSIAIGVHQDASTDSVFSIMTETALQELRNYNAPTITLATASNYNFGKLGGLTSASPGYIYFDADGQIAMDGYRNGSSIIQSSATGSGIQSVDVGILMNSPTLNSDKSLTGKTFASVPYTTAITPLPTGTYYTCKITTVQPRLASGNTTSSMYLVKLVFTWLSGAPQHTRTIFSSVSNNTN